LTSLRYLDAQALRSNCLDPGLVSVVDETDILVEAVAVVAPWRRQRVPRAISQKVMATDVASLNALAQNRERQFQRGLVHEHARIGW
jgi:hypothetical protein